MINRQECLSVGYVPPAGIGVLGGWGSPLGTLRTRHFPVDQAPPSWTDWQTGAKILPFPKLRLRAVNIWWLLLMCGTCGESMGTSDSLPVSVNLSQSVYSCYVCSPFFGCIRDSLKNERVHRRNGSVAMLATKRSAGIAPEVKLRTQEPTYPGVETQERRHRKSKRGVSVTAQIEIKPSNFCFKK